MRTIIGSLLIIASLGVFGVRIYQKETFSKNVTGYIKHAADANTVDIAHEELTKAINYLEANNMTSGSTSVIWETPDEDVGFWYKNLKASQKELAELNSTSALERTNVLMKLRETLMDQGEKARVTVPDGMSAFPNNALWVWLSWGALIGLLAGTIVAVPADKWQVAVEEQKAKSQQ